MDRGTYAAASGGLVQLRKLESINNNLANINSVGFKKELVKTDTQTFEQTFAAEFAGQDPFAQGDHERTPGSVNIASIIDFTQGSIKSTGNNLDVAIGKPKQFFVVQTPAGIEYTRAGNFSINAEGELATIDGMQVQGDGGAVTVGGAGAAIQSDGSVTLNSQKVGQLQVVEISDPRQLIPTGGTRFKLAQGAAAPIGVDQPDLVPASLEMANVSAVSSMVELIQVNRAFELYTKMAQSIDQMNQTAISQVGRAR